MKTKEKISRTARIFQLVISGKSNEEVLEIIKKEYSKKEMGDKVTNLSSVSWARTQLKAKTDYAKKHNPKGIKVLSDAECKKKHKSSKPATAKTTKPADKIVQAKAA